MWEELITMVQKAVLEGQTGFALLNNVELAVFFVGYLCVMLLFRYGDVGNRFLVG